MRVNVEKTHNGIAHRPQKVFLKRPVGKTGKRELQNIELTRERRPMTSDVGVLEVLLEIRCLRLVVIRPQGFREKGLSKAPRPDNGLKPGAALLEHFDETRLVNVGIAIGTD